MNTTVDFQGFIFNLSSKLIETGAKFPFDKNSNYVHNHFKITLSCDGKRIYFDFYGFENDFRNKKKELNEEDLKFAFYCFVSDAIYANDSFEDFCANLGYNEEERSSEQIYKVCCKSLSKIEKILPVECDIYDLCNFLND